MPFGFDSQKLIDEEKENKKVESDGTIWKQAQIDQEALEIANNLRRKSNINEALTKVDQIIREFKFEKEHGEDAYIDAKLKQNPEYRDKRLFTEEENKAYYRDEIESMKGLLEGVKVDWATGELLFFDYGDEAPFMTYGVADPSGRRVHEVPIALPGPRLPHDLGFTTHYAVLHDLPFFHDMDVLRKHKYRVLTFHKDIPTRFGIIPRRGHSKDVRWFECEPCYILHTTNCWEEGDWVVMDGCRSINPMPCAQAGDGELGSMLAYMRLEASAYRWQFNLRTGEVRESAIDDLNTEFNKSNPIFHGVKSKYSYHQRIPLLHEGGHTLRFTGLVKYNNDTGQSTQWDYGEGVFGSEAVFAPKPGADRGSAEDDGYVVTLVTDSKDAMSHCLVFDATDIAQGPVATVAMPHRVPVGFHATWATGEELYR